MPATDDADDGSRRRMPTTDAHDGCWPWTTGYEAFDAAEQVDAADEVRAMARPEARPSQLIHVLARLEGERG